MPGIITLKTILWPVGMVPTIGRKDPTDRSSGHTFFFEDLLDTQIGTDEVGRIAIVADPISIHLLQGRDEGAFGVILTPTGIDCSPVADGCVNLAVRNLLGGPGCAGGTSPKIYERHVAVTPGGIHFSDDEPVGR